MFFVLLWHNFHHRKVACGLYFLSAFVFTFYKNLLKGKIGARKDTRKRTNASNRAVFYTGNCLLFLTFSPSSPVKEAVSYVTRLLHFQKP